MRFFLNITFLVLSAFPLDSLKNTVEISAECSFTSKPPFYVGDTISYCIDVKWMGDRDYYTIMQPQNPFLQNLEIVGRRTSNRVSAMDSSLCSRTRFEYDFKALAHGEASVGEATIYYRSVTDTSPASLAVYSIKAEILTKPKPFPWKKLFLIFLILIVFVVSVYLLLQKRKKLVKKSSTQDKRSAHAKALDALRENEENRVSGNFYSYYTGILRILFEIIRELNKIPESFPGDTKLALNLFREKCAGAGYSEEFENIINELERLRFSGSSALDEEAMLMNRKVTLFIKNLKTT